MGGKIHFAICVIAAILLYGKQPSIIFWIAVATTVINYWSWGIMHNFFLSARGDIDAVPDWVSALNMISTFIGIIMLVLAIILIF